MALLSLGLPTRVAAHTRRARRAAGRAGAARAGRRRHVMVRDPRRSTAPDEALVEVKMTCAQRRAETARTSG